VASMPAQRARSGGTAGAVADHLQPGAWGVQAGEQVEEYVADEPGRAHTEAGEAECIADSAIQCRAENAANLVQVSITPPQAWLNSRPVSCGNVSGRPAHRQRASSCSTPKPATSRLRPTSQA